jgi:hypothetical protein
MLNSYNSLIINRLRRAENPCVIFLLHVLTSIQAASELCCKLFPCPNILFSLFICLSVTIRALSFYACPDSLLFILPNREF